MLREAPLHPMRSRRVKNVLVVAAALVLAALGVSNLVLKASFTLMDDGVFWRQTAAGPGRGARRARRAGGARGRARGRRARRGGRRGGAEPGAARGACSARAGRASARATRCCARASGACSTSRCSRSPRGNVSAFYYLSLAGFFSLVVGTVVLLRRPADRTSLHFYAVCALFFLATRSRTPARSRASTGCCSGSTRSRRCSCPWCSSTSASPSPSGARARCAPGWCRRSTCRRSW